MDSETLRQRQGPLKERYRADPATARTVLRAEAVLDERAPRCRIAAPTPPIAGLHPLAGGDGTEACSGELLLQALVACAGVTLGAVATALGLPLRSARVIAEADWDARGTLGVARDAPVGLTGLSLTFVLVGDVPPERATRLVETTERYCVVLQTLRAAQEVRTTVEQLP